MRFRNGHRSFKTPACDSSTKCCVMNTEFPSPFRQAHRLSAVCYQAATAAISRLLSRGRPAAIFCAIVTIIVLAFNAVGSRRLSPHVSKEISEAIVTEPAFANPYTTSTIISECLDVWIQAPPQHGCIASVLCGPLSVTRFAVDRMDFASPLSLKTPTTKFVARSQCITIGDDSGCPTFAIAFPQNQVVTVTPSEANGGQPPKRRGACQVFNPVIESRQVTGFGRINYSHDEFLSSEGLLWLEPADVRASVRLASFYHQAV